MTQSVIGALRVNLGLDSAQFEKGARKVKAPLAEMRAQFIAVSAAAVAFGAAIGAAALAGARDIDAAAKSARRLDASIGGFRAIELAADEAGVSLSSLTSDIQTMEREIASIGKSGNGQRALDALGLSIADLEGLDADEKLATIADRIKALGLSSGETTAVLRDLGVRNREMVLLVGQGGDAIRNARKDIEDYGLAISQVDSDRIETANDAIGRLGLITQYFGQQLAIAVVPTLGEFAQAITDSLREGGLLRTMIDGLVGNLDRLSAYATAAVAMFGVRFAGAFIAAQVAAFSLSGALLFLRGALIRTGVGALIVGLGEVVYWFGKLVTATGGWGEALTLLGEVAAGVWDGIKVSASAIVPAIDAVWQGVASGFYAVLEEMALKWGNFLWALGTGIHDIPGLGTVGQSLMDASDRAIDKVVEFNAASSSAAGAAIRLKAEASGLASQGFDKAKEAAAKLAEAVKGVGDSTDSAADSVARINDELAKTAGADGGGGGGGAAAAGLGKVKDAVETVKDGMESLKGSAQSAFAGLVTGAKTAKEALAEVLDSFATMLANQAFDALFGGFFGGGGSLFAGIPGNAAGTNNWKGGPTWVGERGPEIVNLPRGAQVIPNHDIRGMGASGGMVDVRVHVDQDGNWRAAVERISGGVVQQGLQSYDRQLAQSVRRVNRDPRKVS